MNILDFVAISDSQTHPDSSVVVQSMGQQLNFGLRKRTKSWHNRFHISDNFFIGWLVGCFEDLRRFSDLSVVSRP